MTNIILTVVVPIYNGQKYIERCLNSLITQWKSHDGYEILCINDGSTDGSHEILLQYAKNYPELIRIINQENKGILAARNKGIEEAKGEIITFCDMDDYLVYGAYQYLYDNFWTEEVDVVSFFSITLDQYVLKNWEETNDLQGEIVFRGKGREYYQRNKQMFVWNHLYRRQFIMKNNLRFSVPRYEDVLFNLDVYMHDPNVIATNACLYRYTVNPDQTTKKRDAHTYRVIVDSFFSICNSIDEYLFQCEDDEMDLRLNLGKIKEEMAVRCLLKGLGGRYSECEFTQLRNRMHEKGELPIRHIGGIQVVLLNQIYKRYFLYRLASLLYVDVLVPYILPHLGRN